MTSKLISELVETLFDGSSQLACWPSDRVAIYSGWGPTAIRDRLLDLAEQYRVEKLDELVEAVHTVAGLRTWPSGWDSRLAALTLETAEFTEAARGKHGNLLKEAGDCLIALVFMLTVAKNADYPEGLTLPEIIEAAQSTLSDLYVRPPYSGEHRQDGK